MASALLSGGPLITHRRGVRVERSREEDGPDGRGSDPRRGFEVERPTTTTTTTGTNRRPGSGSGGLLLGATALLAAAVVVSSVTPVAAQYNYPHAQKYECSACDPAFADEACYLTWCRIFLGLNVGAYGLISLVVFRQLRGLRKSGLRRWVPERLLHWIVLVMTLGRMTRFLLIVGGHEKTPIVAVLFIIPPSLFYAAYGLLLMHWMQIIHLTSAPPDRLQARRTAIQAAYLVSTLIFFAGAVTVTVLSFKMDWKVLQEYYTGMIMFFMFVLWVGFVYYGWRLGRSLKVHAYVSAAAARTYAKVTFLTRLSFCLFLAIICFGLSTYVFQMPVYVLTTGFFVSELVLVIGLLYTARPFNRAGKQSVERNEYTRLMEAQQRQKAAAAAAAAASTPAPGMPGSASPAKRPMTAPIDSKPGAGNDGGWDGGSVATMGARQAATGGGVGVGEGGLTDPGNWIASSPRQVGSARFAAPSSISPASTAGTFDTYPALGRDAFPHSIQ